MNSLPNTYFLSNDFSSIVLSLSQEGILAISKSTLRIVYANSASEKYLTGDGKTSLIDKSIVNDFSVSSSISSEGQPWDIFHRLANNDCHQHQTGYFIRLNGSIIPVQFSTHDIDNNLKLVIFSDISSFRAIEDALRRSDETLQKAQEIAHIGSWDWDITTGELSWTDEIYRIFGLTPQQFGATYAAFLEYIHPEDQDLVIQAVNASVADASIPYSIEHRVVQPLGEIRIVHERGKVYRDELGNPIRMIGTVHDITERKLAENEIRKLNEELEDRVAMRTHELALANNELQQSLTTQRNLQSQLVQAEKMASLGSLVAGIAHEINTPIGIGVTAASHLIHILKIFEGKYTSNSMTRNDLEKLLNTSNKSAQSILTNLDRAADLVNNFKQVAVDQSSGKIRRFDLAEYLQSIIASLQPRLRNTKCNIKIDCPKPLFIETDPGAISQIITNLIINSLIHGFEDRPKEQGDIRIRLLPADSGGDWILHYEDDGKGMDKSTLSKLFDPFFTTKRGHGGSGLGMHIVYNLVTQKLASHITAESAPNQGTRIIITLNSGLFAEGAGEDKSAA